MNKEKTDEEKHKIEEEFKVLQGKLQICEDSLKELESKKHEIHEKMEILRAEFRELVYPPKFEHKGYASVYDYQPVPNRKVEVITRGGSTHQGIASKFDYTVPVMESAAGNVSEWKYI